MLPTPIDGGSVTATHCRSRDGSFVNSSPVPSESTCTPGYTHGFGAGAAGAGVTSFDGVDSPTAFTAVTWYVDARPAAVARAVFGLVSPPPRAGAVELDPPRP